MAIDFSNGLWVDITNDGIPDLPAGSVYVDLASGTYSAYLDDNRASLPSVGSTNGNTDAYGTAGNDVMYAVFPPQSLFFGSFLWGLAGNDLLVGSPGNDIIDGGTGMDDMSGFGGNDVFYIDSYSDVVTEFANGGEDAVMSTGLDLDLADYANVEHLAAYGNTSGVKLVGNAGSNQLSAWQNSVQDILIGYDGDDRYIIDDLDVVIETANGGLHDSVRGSLNINLGLPRFQYVEDASLGGTANWNIYGTSGANSLNGNSGDNGLFGGAGKDNLIGELGDDILDGGSGADIMTGGGGNDTYYWDNALDQIIELAGGGTDQIRSFVSLDMNASAGLQQVERGYTYGSANITIYGNNLQNVLGGNGGTNRLEGRGGIDLIDGGAGNDFIIGGADRDTMTGGTGRDGYRWYATTETGNTAGARDIITDFASITDTGNALTSDYLDLSPIDANTTNGTHVFAFIGFNTAFTAAGQLRYRYEGGNTVIEGNVDGNLASDFQIQLTGLETLIAADFML